MKVSVILAKGAVNKTLTGWIYVLEEGQAEGRLKSDISNQRIVFKWNPSDFASNKLQIDAMIIRVSFLSHHTQAVSERFNLEDCSHVERYQHWILCFS